MRWERDACSIVCMALFQREHIEAIQLEEGYAEDRVAPEAVAEPGKGKHVRR